MRLFLAIKAFFRVLFDREAAHRVQKALEGASDRPSVEILRIFQRDGRLVDFLQEDIEKYSDQQVGQAVRTVHRGCRKALQETLKLAPIRSESEGSPVQVEPGFDPSQIQLVGRVTGSGPYRGVLKHHGWQVVEMKVPATTEASDPGVITPAEVEVE